MCNVKNYSPRIPLEIERAYIDDDRLKIRFYHGVQYWYPYEEGYLSPIVICTRFLIILFIIIFAIKVRRHIKIKKNNTECPTGKGK